MVVSDGSPAGPKMKKNPLKKSTLAKVPSANSVTPKKKKVIKKKLSKKSSLVKNSLLNEDLCEEENGSSDYKENSEVNDLREKPTNAKSRGKKNNTGKKLKRERGNNEKFGDEESREKSTDDSAQNVQNDNEETNDENGLSEKLTKAKLRKEKKNKVGKKIKRKKESDENSEDEESREITDNSSQDDEFGNDETNNELQEAKVRSPVKRKYAEIKTNITGRLEKKEIHPEVLARTIVVRNLATTNILQLKKHFSSFGVVEKIKIVKDPIHKTKALKKKLHSQTNTAYAFIRFLLEKSAIKAAEANGVFYHGRRLTIFVCGDPKKKRDKSKSIFVGNLHNRANEDHLWKTFESCGPIASVYVARQRSTGSPRAFGFVTFFNSDAVARALEMKNVKIISKEVRITTFENNVAKNVTKEMIDEKGEGIKKEREIDEKPEDEESEEKSSENSSDGEDTDNNAPSEKLKNKRKLLVNDGSQEADAPPQKKNKSATNAENEIYKCRNEEEERRARTVLVKNIPFKANVVKLMEAFSKFGIIDDITIMQAPSVNPQIPKKPYHVEANTTYGFIRFQELESAKKALEANGMILNGRHLSLSLCFGPAIRYDSSKAIFVGSLNIYTEEEDLWKTFEPCGRIKAVQIFRDSKTLLSKGFGFVNFENSDAVTRAMEMKNVIIRNKQVKVKAYMVDTKKTNVPGEMIGKAGEENNDEPEDEENREETTENSCQNVEIDNEKTNDVSDVSKELIKAKSNKRKLVTNDEPQEAEVVPCKKSNNSTNTENETVLEEKWRQEEKDPEVRARTVYVKNIPVNSNILKLVETFSKFGKVDNIQIMQAPVANLKTPLKFFHLEEKTTYGFIRFQERESALEAIKANGMIYNNRHLLISSCDNAKEKSDRSKTILVKNLHLCAEDEDLWNTFESCGHIKSVNVVRNIKTGLSKGFGFVNFANFDSVICALQMGNVKIRNKEVDIIYKAAKKGVETNEKSEEEESQKKPTDDSFQDVESGDEDNEETHDEKDLSKEPVKGKSNIENGEAPNNGFKAKVNKSGKKMKNGGTKVKEIENNENLEDEENRKRVTVKTFQRKFVAKKKMKPNKDFLQKKWKVK